MSAHDNDILFREGNHQSMLLCRMDITDPRSSRGHGERALWVASLQQSIDDIADEPLGSTEYGDAAAFFTGGGEWAISRSAVAGHIDLHSDDLERCGRRCIAARRVAEGLPIEIIRAKAPAVPMASLPMLEAIPAPVRRPVVREKPRHDKRRWFSQFMGRRTS
jgi:hypothetical protein